MTFFYSSHSHEIPQTSCNTEKILFSKYIFVLITCLRSTGQDQCQILDALLHQSCTDNNFSRRDCKSSIKKKKRKHSNFKHLGSYTRKQKVDLSLYLAAFSLISDAFPNLAQNFLFLLALGKSSKIAWHSLFEKITNTTF